MYVMYEFDPQDFKDSFYVLNVFKPDIGTTLYPLSFQ